MSHSDNLLDFIKTPTKVGAKKFSQKVEDEATQQAGDAAWEVTIKLHKLIDDLPVKYQEPIRSELNKLNKVLSLELAAHKRAEAKKANVGNRNASRFSKEEKAAAIKLFNSLNSKLSKQQRAEIVSSKTRANPSAKTITRWVDESKVAK